MRISLNCHMACDVLEDMRFFKNFKTNELLRHKLQDANNNELPEPIFEEYQEVCITNTPKTPQ